MTRDAALAAAERYFDEDGFIADLSHTYPRELNPDIPAALEKAVLKCLERDPDKRYPYMSVLVRDLQAALYV